jgi:hypothetical protein
MVEEEIRALTVIRNTVLRDDGRPPWDSGRPPASHEGDGRPPVVVVDRQAIILRVDVYFCIRIFNPDFAYFYDRCGP